MELEKKHWEQVKLDNQNLILQNTIMTQLAELAIKHAEIKIAEFPEEPKEPEKPKT